MNKKMFDVTIVSAKSSDVDGRALGFSEVIVPKTQVLAVTAQSAAIVAAQTLMPKDKPFDADTMAAIVSNETSVSILGG